MSYKVASDYTHVQDTAASTWNIAHNLGVYPVVDVYVQVGGQLVKILATTSYIDQHNITVTFSSAQTGFARCT